MTTQEPTSQYSAEKLFWHIGGSMLVTTVVLAVVGYGRIPLDSRLTYKPPQPALVVPLDGTSLTATSDIGTATILEGTAKKDDAASVSFERFAGILPQHTADIKTDPHQTTVTSTCQGIFNTRCRYKARYVVPQGLSVTTHEGPVALKGTFTNLEINQGSVITEDPISATTLRMTEASPGVLLHFSTAPKQIDIQGDPDTVDITVPQGVTYRIKAPDSAILEGSDLSRDTTDSSHTITIDVPKTTSVIVRAQDG